jgi:protein-S-isoprenylcysteine O-methyltransferase Ste14
MTDRLLAVTVFCELAAAAAVLYSIRFPARRIWPPDGPSSWKMFFMGCLFFFSALGIGVLGLTGWGGWGWPAGIRFGLGLPPLIGGMTIFIWAQAILGFGVMMGREGKLVMEGPFRFSRNPQYTGCLAMLAGCWSPSRKSRGCGSDTARLLKNIFAKCRASFLFGRCDDFRKGEPCGRPFYQAGGDKPRPNEP